MSDLKFLENLLNGSEVKFVPMGQIISRAREKGKSNREIKTVYSVSNMHGLVKAEDFRDNTIHSEDTSNYTIVRQGMFAYNPARLNIGSIAFLKTDADGLVSPMYVVFSVNEEIATKEYIDFFIKSSYCMNKINSLTEEGARFRFDFERWDLIEVPIPSIDVQTKIVDILNTFTKLNTELITELASRKKQYNYYRDQLLRFEDGEVEWKPLEEVFDIFAGGDAPKEALSMARTEEFDIPILSNGIGEKSLYGWTNKAKIDKPSLTISARGTIGWTSYREAPFFPIVRLLVLTPKTRVDLKYAYYFMKTIENDYKVPEAGIPQLTKPMLKDITIPVPYPGDPDKSLAEQARIVAILDKFDALTNSISEGLPGEIALRQKQYAYYRDLLLSFPKPEEVAA